MWRNRCHWRSFMWSGCANPCGGEGRVGNRPLGRGPNRPWGALAAGTGRSGLGVGMEGLGVHRGLRLSWALKASAPAPEDRGPRFAEGPAQRETAKAEVHGGAAVRGRVGERSCAQLQRRPRDREGFQINSDPEWPDLPRPSGIWRSLCSWWQVSGAGSPAWAAFRKGFREGLCLLRVQGAAPGRGRGADAPSMG